MTFQLYGIKDVCTRFVHMFVEDNDATATRLFKSWTQGKYAADNYELWHLGAWDTQTGIITPIKKMEFLCDGSEVVK